MADAMKLLPCPMCGGEAALLDYEARYGGLHYASRCPQCASCGCSMGYLPTAKKAVEAWNCRASMPPEKTTSFDDARRKLIHCIEQWDGETEYDAEDIAALADDILDVFASPPAREEAPAEGAGEPMSDREVRQWIDACNHEPGRQVLRDYLALRNRTSEPEAGFLGHLVTPKGGDAVFIPKGERIPLISQGGSVTPIYDGPQNVTAPATDDKLRVAVEALERIERRRQTGAYDEVEAWELQDIARQALAALNEQPQ